MASGRSRTDGNSGGYDRSVFINCPFDDAYRPLFHAILFSVLACGLIPRSALEIGNSDGGKTRLERIWLLIADCRWGVHDISRVEPNAQGLPRFNMPLELGMFMGAQRFGRPRHRNKHHLVMDTDPRRFRDSASDIAGMEVAPHGGDPNRVVGVIRGWFARFALFSEAALPGPQSIVSDFARFEADLPELCRSQRVAVTELTPVERIRLASAWLRATYPDALAVDPDPA